MRTAGNVTVRPTNHNNGPPSSPHVCCDRGRHPGEATRWAGTVANPPAFAPARPLVTWPPLSACTTLESRRTRNWGGAAVATEPGPLFFVGHKNVETASRPSPLRKPPPAPPAATLTLRVQRATHTTGARRGPLRPAPLICRAVRASMASAKCTNRNLVTPFTCRRPSLGSGRAVGRSGGRPVGGRSGWPDDTHTHIQQWWRPSSRGFAARGGINARHKFATRRTLCRRHRDDTVPACCGRRKAPAGCQGMLAASGRSTTQPRAASKPLTGTTSPALFLFKKTTNIPACRTHAGMLFHVRPEVRYRRHKGPYVNKHAMLGSCRKCSKHGI